MNRLSQLRRGQEGFTLIELLVVVAIIALLATFAVPKLFDAINKSKKAPGQADMQTVSSGIERYYFDKDKYPVYDGAKAKPADDVMAVLRDTYVKKAATFRNGFRQGYLYATSTNGKGYVLVDMQGETWDDGAATGSQIEMVCSTTVTPPALPSTTTITWTLVQSDTASLTTPDGGTMIPDDRISGCVLTSAANKDKVTVVTH